MNDRLIRTDALDYETDSLSVEMVIDHLRSANGTAENDYLERLIKASIRLFEHRTGRLLLPQTWTWSRDVAPCEAWVCVPLTPIVSVDAIDYIDPNGDAQTFGGSPSPWTLSNPTLESNAPAVLRLAYGQIWPATRNQPDAWSVSLTAGYPIVGGECAIPEDIQQGRLLVIGELYKQRSESVHASNQSPAIRGANALWDSWRVFR